MKFSVKFFSSARVVAAVFSLACAAASAQTPDAPKEIDVDVSEELKSGFIASPEERAEQYIKSEDYGNLLLHAQKWTKNYPGDSNGWNYLGRALREQNDIKGSADAFGRAWELSDKKNYRIIESIGDIYYQEKEWENAEDAYRKAVELREARAVLWEKLAESIMKARAPAWKSEAAAALKMLLSFGEYVNDPKRWRQYAEILDLLNTDTNTLYRAYRHVVRLTVRDIGAWERLYDIETERGKEGEKAKIVRILYRLSPDNAIANLHYGMEVLDTHPRDARKYLEIALKSDKISGARRAQIYVIFGDMEKYPARALENYRQAVVSDPANLGAWEKAIVRLRNLGRRRQAQAAYEKLLAVERKIQRNEKISENDAVILLQ